MLEPAAWIYAAVGMSWWVYTTGQQLKLQVTGAFNWISVLFPYDKQGSGSISDCATPLVAVSDC